LRAFILIGAICLAGCSSMGTAGSTALQDAEKALTAARAAHDAAAVTATMLANAGALKGQNAALAKQYLDQSEADLKAADAAVALGQADTVTQEVAAATALVKQISALTGSR